MNRHLNTVILALGAAALLAGSLTAASTAPPSDPAAGAPRAGVGAAKAPKAAAVEPVIDVGTIPAGDKAAHDFEIRNEGEGVLMLTDVRAACGCTVASFDKTIAPGQSGKVHVIVDTLGFNGPIAKGVTVFTNDPKNPQIELTVRAKIQPYIVVDPGYARYVTVRGEGKQGNIVQTLYASDGEPMDIVKVESPFPYLTISYREAQEGERLPDVKAKQWRVEMVLSNDAAVGALIGHVTIHTNHPKQKLVQIPVSGFVRPVVAVTPPVADFGKIELKTPLHRTLDVRSFATEPIKMIGLEGQIKGIEAKLKPIEEGREYQLLVTLDPAIGKGPFYSKLVIHTDSPKSPIVEVELKGTIL
ncbi:MAG TPA: DUF1573 domain-containing protein [Thermoanaerobaculia bacterium]|nr:DUF1573 domain-containing protein [Thermoanaerobaculia bacterium]